MTQEICNHWSNACAAQICNLHVSSDDPPHLKFQKIASLVNDVILLALVEERLKMLQPSDN